MLLEITKREEKGGKKIRKGAVSLERISSEKVIKGEARALHRRDKRGRSEPQAGAFEMLNARLEGEEKKKKKGASPHAVRRARSGNVSLAPLQEKNVEKKNLGGGGGGKKRRENENDLSHEESA